MPEKDPYDILGVPRGAKQDEIKRAYRRLAKAYHPDRNPGKPEAERRFKEVQAAYEVLGDPQRREQYDRFGAGGPAPEFHTWSTPAPGASEVRFDFGSLGDLSSIFEQFFRRGPQAPYVSEQAAPTPRGADIERSVEVSLEEALQGTTREIVLRSRGGAVERVTVRIPPGIEDGQRIRARGQGQAGRGGRGDLLIVCRVRPHGYFQRQGRDLLLELPLSFAEAALGATVDVPTLEGRVRLKVPPGTSSGARLRLRGKGVPGRNGEPSGDLLVVPRIHVPRDLSPRARQLVEQLERELDEAPRADAAWAGRET
jgi:DnaJ-class molecular chaperone